jgi:diadenylate cyclase
MSEQTEARRSSVEARLLVNHTFELAQSLNVDKIIVQADKSLDIRAVQKLQDDETIIWLTRDAEALAIKEDQFNHVIEIARGAFMSMNVISMGLFLSVINGYLDHDESVICVSGIAGTRRLDTLVVTNPKRHLEWLEDFSIRGVSATLVDQTFIATVDIALRFATEGREGRPLGTIFVIGPSDQLEKYLRQLILNPVEGHPRRLRNVQSPDFLETLRELASVDGAFIISPDGVVESAGTFLAAPASSVSVRPGLGARHTAAAAVTAVTDAIAIVLSQSSGTVTVFHEGQSVLEMEKPRSVAPKSRRRAH